jgi:CBS domain-containing protein
VTGDRAETAVLGDLLSERRVIAPLRADTLREALGKLAAGAVADGLADQDRLDQELDTLAEEDLIPLGSHALMAHLRTEGANRLGMMIGLAEGALPFSPATAPEARTLILVIAPASGGRRYLQTMAALARVLGKSEVAEQLASVETAADVLGLSVMAEPILGTEILVRDVMTRDVVIVSAETPMADVAELLIRRRLRAIPVVGEDRVVLGIVTDADVMEMFLPRIRGDEATGNEGTDPAKLAVREVMQRSVFTARADETIESVADRMIRKGIERLPVVTEGRLVGFLSKGDIIRRLLRGHLRSR